MNYLEKINQLARQINQCAYDLDPYEHQDCYNSLEEGYEDMREGLMTNPEGIKKGLTEYLESMDDAELEDVKEMKYLLNQIDLLQLA